MKLPRKYHFSCDLFAWLYRVSETDKVLLPQAFHSVLQAHLGGSEVDTQTFSFLLRHHISWFRRLIVSASARNVTKTHPHFISESINQSVKTVDIEENTTLKNIYKPIKE